MAVGPMVPGAEMCLPQYDLPNVPGTVKARGQWGGDSGGNEDCVGEGVIDVVVVSISTGHL